MLLVPETLFLQKLAKSNTMIEKTREREVFDNISITRLQTVLRPLAAMNGNSRMKNAIKKGLPTRQGEIKKSQAWEVGSSSEPSNDAGEAEPTLSRGHQQREGKR